MWSKSLKKKSSFLILLQRQSLGVVLKNSFSERFRKMFLKTPVTETFISIVADLTRATAIKADSYHRCFSANLRTVALQSTLEKLLVEDIQISFAEKKCLALRHYSFSAWYQKRVINLCRHGSLFWSNFYDSHPCIVSQDVWIRITNYFHPMESFRTFYATNGFISMNNINNYPYCNNYPW